MTLKKYFLALSLLLSTVSVVFAQPADYPKPEKKENSLFYIQRNHNSNTIVYEAVFDKNGKLNEAQPVDVYWLRYDEDGRRKELGTLDKMYAYGVKCRKNKNAANQFDVKLVADKKRVFTLKWIKPFTAAIFTEIDNKDCMLDRLYIQADNSGLWPEVKYVELFGKDAKSKKKVYEKFIVND